MHTKPIRPGLTAATTAGRALLAAGWRYDSTSPMADDTTIRTLLHPSGRQIDARTVDGDDTTSLTMTGLSLEQVAGAITGAGLAPTEPEHLEQRDTEPDLRQRLAAELHRIADDIVTRQLPIGRYAFLRLGVVDSRADLDPWAGYLGTTIDAPDGTDIPSVTAKILLTDCRYGPDLTIGVQSPKGPPELERLRARNAELEAQLAEGGAS